jgi:hypothetical protein
VEVSLQQIMERLYMSGYISALDDVHNRDSSIPKDQVPRVLNDAKEVAKALVKAYGLAADFKIECPKYKELP